MAIKSKYIRILYSFFLHFCFKIVNRLASGSPVTWVQQAQELGPLSFVDCTMAFFLECKKRGKQTIRGVLQREYHKVKHQDVTSLKLKDNRSKVWLMQS